MITLKTKLLCNFFLGKISTNKIEHLFSNNSSRPCVQAKKNYKNNIKVSTVSIKIKPYNSLEQFIEHMEYFVKSAYEQQSDIVCFPQFTGLLPMALLPFFDELISYIYNDYDKNTRQDIVDITDIFDIVGAEVFNCYYNVFSLLASKYNIYIHAGSSIVPTKMGLYNQAFIFDNKGNSICEQNKINPSRIEQSFNLCSGNMIDVFQIPMGKIATVIGDDQYYFETYKVARNLGAKIIFSPSGPSFNSNIFKSLRGCAMRVQESKCFSIKSCLVGKVGGRTFSDLCGIFAPYYATNDTGYIAISEKFCDDDIVTADININSLHNVTETYTSDVNRDFYKLNMQRYNSDIKHIINMINK